ncbi:MAG: abortive phage resistance protein [Calditrichaeota bacterium]|nr:MAG: abortive phage resistance protein [Calditrichota bacterium]
MFEKEELQRFFIDLQEDINARLVSEEDGSSPEQIFTDFALGLLADAGETENYRLCYDEKVTKRGIEHKINAYALYENYETLDLFIVIYNAEGNIKNVAKKEIEKSFARLRKFFRNAIYKDYLNELDESSEVFDLAHTLANVPEIKEFLSRVNFFVVTNGIVNSSFIATDTVAGYPAFWRVIDLEYLFNLAEKSRVPIEIDFEGSGVFVPCIECPSENDDYQSYVAIIPGLALANIYEQYGPRLLEQNVRSFLQFTGKINKGIRKTILEEPHMFLAFNNGISATAEKVKVIEHTKEGVKSIGFVKDFQIVNGGQTTASLYHTWKKNKANIANVFVQLKLTIIKNRENFAEIVGRIAEYANTQNRVSASDLSSNRENHIVLEKLSRTIWAPPKRGETHQTRWFFERSRGQYKNERNRYGTTPARKRQFDRQNPRNQVFTKEQLAKYVNSYSEVYHGKKLVVGPHIVVRGSQKNYSQFLNYNFHKKPDSVYFEDVVALAILFKTAEKIYGIKPNAIGDMRYITVPYAIAWLGFRLNYKLDLYRIWKAQDLSDKLKEKLYEIMVKVENFIKSNAPGALYGEWAKKEDCWIMLKNCDLNISLETLCDDLIDDSSLGRKRMTDEEITRVEVNESIERIRSVHPKVWKKIEEWGRATGNLTQYQLNIAYALGKKVRNNRKLTEVERKRGNNILDIVLEKAPDILSDLDEIIEESEEKLEQEVSLDLVKRVVMWDKKHKKLKIFEYKFMEDIAEGRRKLTERNKRLARLNIAKVKKFGFREGC